MRLVNIFIQEQQAVQEKPSTDKINKYSKCVKGGK